MGWGLKKKKADLQQALMLFITFREKVRNFSNYYYYILLFSEQFENLKYHIKKPLYEHPENSTS